MRRFGYNKLLNSVLSQKFITMVRKKEGAQSCQQQKVSLQELQWKNMQLLEEADGEFCY